MMIKVEEKISLKEQSALLKKCIDKDLDLKLELKKMGLTYDHLRYKNYTQTDVQKNDYKSIEELMQVKKGIPAMWRNTFLGWIHFQRAVCPWAGWGYTPYQTPLHSLFSGHETQNFSQDKNQNSASASRSTAADLKQSGIDFAPSADEVARSAYFSYVNEGSLPGHDVQHWLEAEKHLVAERNVTRVHRFDKRT